MAQGNYVKENKIQEFERRIQALEAKVRLLESVVNGSDGHTPGKKPLLSYEQKAEIIRRHNGNASYATLAHEYGVSKTTISNICNPPQ